MRGIQWVVPLACGAALAACTFPDVGYADGGAGGSTSSNGDPCTDLSTCTASVPSCVAPALGTHASCVQRCKNDPACVTTCDQELDGAREGCATMCEHCAATCSTAAPACLTAAGL